MSESPDNLLKTSKLDSHYLHFYLRGEVFMKALIFGVIITASSICSAEQKIYGLDLVNRLSSENSLHYNELWKELEKSGIPRFDAVLPFKRQLLEFHYNPDSCLFPGAISVLKQGMISKDFSLIEGAGVDYVGLTALTRASSKPITKLEDLHGKRVGMWNGIQLDHLSTHFKKMTITTVKNEDQLIQLLNAERVDAILAFFPDILLTASRLNLDLPIYDGRFWILPKVPATMVCHDTNANRQLIDKFNHAINTLRSNKKLEEILGPLVEITPE